MAEQQKDSMSNKKMMRTITTTRGNTYRVVDLTCRDLWDFWADREERHRGRIPPAFVRRRSKSFNGTGNASKQALPAAVNYRIHTQRNSGRRDKTKTTDESAIPVPADMLGDWDDAPDRQAKTGENKDDALDENEYNFTLEQDTRLAHWKKENPSGQWAMIGNELGKHKDECKGRYNSLKNLNKLEKLLASKSSSNGTDFTHYQDVQLVKFRTQKDKLSWEHVGRELGKSPTDCENRMKQLQKDKKIKDLRQESNTNGTKHTVVTFSHEDDVKLVQIKTKKGAHLSWDEIAREVGKPADACEARMKQLQIDKKIPDLKKEAWKGDARSDNQDFSHKDDIKLVVLKTQSGAKFSWAEIARELGKSVDACQARMKQLGQEKKIDELKKEGAKLPPMELNTPFSHEEDDLLFRLKTENGGSKSWNDIAKELGKKVGECKERFGQVQKSQGYGDSTTVKRDHSAAMANLEKAMLQKSKAGFNLQTFYGSGFDISDDIRLVRLLVDPKHCLTYEQIGRQMAKSAAECEERYKKLCEGGVFRQLLDVVRQTDEKQTKSTTAASKLDYYGIYAVDPTKGARRTQLYPHISSTDATRGKWSGPDSLGNTVQNRSSVHSWLEGLPDDRPGDFGEHRRRQWLEPHVDNRQYYGKRETDSCVDLQTKSPRHEDLEVQLTTDAFFTVELLNILIRLIGEDDAVKPARLAYALAEHSHVNIDPEIIRRKLKASKHGDGQQMTQLDEFISPRTLRSLMALEQIDFDNRWQRISDAHYGLMRTRIDPTTIQNKFEGGG